MDSDMQTRARYDLNLSTFDRACGTDPDLRVATRETRSGV